MKVLTIKEPWATLIIEGKKEYEFRSWKTNYRGKILVHSGKKREKEIQERFKDYNLTYSYGEIIGEVELVECILITKEFNEKLNKENSLIYGLSDHTGKYAWKIVNPKKYEQKIKINGKLGIWNYK